MSETNATTTANSATSAGELAASEVARALTLMRDRDVARLSEAVLDARHVVCYAGGREGLAMRGFVMRLFHAGMAASFVGDMTSPRVAAGDLVLLSSGPGSGEITRALLHLAKDAGARVILLTASPGNGLALDLDKEDVVALPGRTMADDEAEESVLPMGSVYEVVLFVVGDLVTQQVRNRRREPPEALRLRHTNLE